MRYDCYTGGQHLAELEQTARHMICLLYTSDAADNTRGNAEETADWIRREKIISIRIVTASYHMPRSLLEFHQVLPAGITIIPHPVFPGGFLTESWWRDVNALKLAISEYHKYLLACL